MNIESVKVACFSPTGTTAAVAKVIARGIAPDAVELIDITTPDARTQPLHTGEGDLLVVAAPVYSGRIPALVAEWLQGLQARNTPAVCIVVYGNRDYEDALLELETLVSQAGGIPIAGAAHIGEHSFSTADMPTAHGRPDARDLRNAEEFGQRIREKLLSSTSMTRELAVHVPGVFPYRKDPAAKRVDFIAVDEGCVQCGLCAEVCPVGAIDPDDSFAIDISKCITCCACIKRCPQGARSIKPGPIQDASVRLNAMCAEPKEPEYFL